MSNIVPASSMPVTVHPSKRYFIYKGEPIVLITSDQTYFAVTTSSFDYARFLDTLAAHGMNFTRIYPGAHPAQTWPPLIFPWAKNADGKYDLDAWNTTYFERLHGFMSYARTKGIIVDIVLFNACPSSLSPAPAFLPTIDLSSIPRNLSQGTSVTLVL